VSGLPPRGLRGLLYAGGALATSAGLHTLLAGGRSFPPWRHADAVLESELRYYGGFYAAFGLHVLRTAPRADRDPEAVRAIAATVFLSGLGRAGGWRAIGRPHPLQRVLLALELGLPVLMVAGQRRPPGS
jgi:hypothetical protein